MDELGRLASQTATYKLGQILSLLVLPIIVLLAIYFMKAKGEIDVLSRERAGVRLAQVALSVSSRSPDENLFEIDYLEQLIGLSADKRFANVRTMLASKAPLGNLTLSDYLTRVGNASHAVLDSERESQAISEVVFELVPVYQTKIETLASTMSTGQITASQGLPHADMFLMETGEAQFISRRIEDGLKIAGIFKVPELVAPLAKLQETAAALDSTATLLGNVLISTLDKQKQVDVLRQKQMVFSTIGAKDLQSTLLVKLENRLSDRSRTLWRNLTVLALAGISSALAGIGLAILMMRSTLLRLDEVEMARNDAIAARGEAEAIAVRFTTTNAEITQLNQDMAKNVQQLHKAQEELIKKGRMEQLGQLIATIAHEVRNPLGAIRTTIFMVERKVADKGLGLEGHLQRINNSVNRCDTIISQLLDFARTKEVNSAPILLDDWIAKTVREEAARLPENIFIECSLGLENELVSIDPVRMQRALVNLLNNAVEALSGQQDREETVSQLGHHIWVSTKRLGDHAVIRVADNGPGIAPEYIQKIREPLFTTKSFGTGLGIPAVEQVVNQHGGRLEISSDIGKGAVFSLYLPIHRGSEIAA